MEQFRKLGCKELQDIQGGSSFLKNPIVKAFFTAGLTVPLNPLKGPSITLIVSPISKGIEKVSVLSRRYRNHYIPSGFFLLHWIYISGVI